MEQQGKSKVLFVKEFHSRKRITLPWNYSASPKPPTERKDKPSSPRFTARKPSSPRGGHRKMGSPVPATLANLTKQTKQGQPAKPERDCLVELPPPAQKKKRVFCWCCGGEEMAEENQFTSVLQPYSEPIVIDQPMKRTEAIRHPSGLSATMPLPQQNSHTGEVPSDRLTRSSIFNFDSMESTSRESSPFDQGMGSFIQDLKRSSSHCVSSRSWNTST